MRIAYDYQVFAFQTYGGISRYFTRLVEEFAKKPDVSPTVVAPLHVNAYLKGLPRRTVRGFAIPATATTRRVARQVGRRLAPMSMRLLRPDVVHETYFAPTRSAARDMPTVVTVHDMIHERFADLYPASDQTRAVKRAAVLRADHVICVSEHTRRDLLEYIPEAESKSSVILHGFDSFSETTAENSAPSGEAPYLLFVGERSRYKNFARFIAAYASSEILRRDFRIVCIGGGSLTADERAMLARLGLDAKMVLHRQGGDDVLANAYRQAAAFVYPSLYEGFGIPPLEAMAASCPVIGSDRSSIPEICGDAVAYFDPYDTESIRSAIESVVVSSTTRDTLVARGHERLRQFSWARCAARTLDVYRSIA